MVRPRPWFASMLVLMPLLASIASASISWIQIADVAKIHETYNTTVVYRARWWDIHDLPVDIELPPTNTILVKLTAMLTCKNGVPPRYNITFYVSYAGHNMSRRVVGYSTAGAEYLGYLRLNKTISGKLHVDLATDAKGCTPYLHFAMVYYNARLVETIDWQPPGNATLTFEYTPPSPHPEKLDIAYMIDLDPASEKSTATMPPTLEPLIPVTEDMLNETLPSVIARPLKALASHIINKTVELTKDRSVEKKLKSLAPETLVALSLRPLGQQPQQKLDLYVPANASYLYLAPVNVTKVYRVSGANYTMVNVKGHRALLLRDLEDHVEAQLLAAVPTSVHYFTPDFTKELVVPGGALYLPAEINADVHHATVVLETKLPNATVVDWRGAKYNVSFSISNSTLEASIRVNNATASKKIVVGVEETPVCYYLDHLTCGKIPVYFAYSQWGFLRIEGYSESMINATYIVPPLFNETIGNKTVLGVLENDKLAVLVFGEMRPDTSLAGLTVNGSVAGTLVAISDVPRRAAVIQAVRGPGGRSLQIVYEPMRIAGVYVTAFNVYGYWQRVVFSAKVDVRVRDASTGSPLAAEILALQNGTVVDRARGSDVTLKLFPGNYTLEARIGSLAFYRNLTVKDDMDVTIKVTLPKVTNVTVKAPRYSFGETELRITVKLDKPAPADYNITGRIVVDDSWERSFTIPVKANTTEASTVVKLSLGEGKHHIKIIVGNAVAEAEVTVASGSLGFAVAAVVGITAVGVVLFLLRRPREIAF